MLAELSSEDLVAKWEEFFEEYNYRGKITGAADKYPEEKSLFVNFPELNRFDTDVVLELFRNPDKVVQAGKKALKRFLPPDIDADLNLRINNLPRDFRIDVRALRSNHLGKFISVEGLVKTVTEVRPMIFKAVFQCVRCGARIPTLQETTRIQEPMECLKEGEGGCGRPASMTRFKLIAEESGFRDTQALQVQEKPEQLRGGEMPQRLSVHLEDDMTGLIWPGARIILNGVLRATMWKGSTVFHNFLELNSIEMEKKEFEEIVITPEDEERIKEAAADKDIFRNIINSICPTMYGLSDEKEALALQLFGGVAKTMQDGTKIRGDMHMLLIGDPGTGKSQILSYMSKLAPRGIYTSGKSSTAAGLTAAAVKDATEEGRWTLEAGTVVLADKGLACIDEIDKMDEKDRSSIHEAMEQQTVSVAKAGIQATLPARCSILGAANFKLGRYDKNKTIPDQINLPATLLSRLDVIYSMIDKPNADMDGAMAEHILNEHWVGQKLKRREMGEDIPVDRFEEHYAPHFDPDFLRKYVAFAKQNVFPMLTQEAKGILKENYLRIRRMGEGEESETVPITPRQLEAYVRLAEASARARLSQTVERDDAERAVRIMNVWLGRVTGTGPGSMFDIDIVATGISRSQRDQISIIRGAMQALSTASADGFCLEGDIAREAEARGLPGSKVESLISKLRQEGIIYGDPRRGYKLV